MSIKRKFFIIFLIASFFSTLFAQTKTDYDTKIEAISSINWIRKQIVTKMYRDTKKAEIQMSSGKKLAST